MIRDTRAAAEHVPDCLALNADDHAACDRDRATAVEPDPLAAAARADDSGLVSVLDVTDRFCDDEVCRFVVDGHITYFDHGHMTASFSRTFAPLVAREVGRAMRR